MKSPGRQTADHPERPPLSAERIALCAIAMADEQGLEALSMRRLADRLGVEAMSLYHHVPSKAALLEAMADQLGRTLPLPPAIAWRESLLAAARSWRDLARRHPGLFPLLATRATAGEALLDRVAILIGRLQAGGFTPAATPGPCRRSSVAQRLPARRGRSGSVSRPARTRARRYPFDEARALLARFRSRRGSSERAAFEFHVAMLLDGSGGSAARRRGDRLVSRGVGGSYAERSTGVNGASRLALVRVRP